MVTNAVTVLIPFWGMVGIWTHKIGFHNAWEFWLVGDRCCVWVIHLLTNASMQGI